MFRYILKRLLLTISVMLGVSFIVFFIKYLSRRDVADKILLRDATPEEKGRPREEMDHDRNIFIQYIDYFRRFFKGDFGVFYSSKIKM